MDGRSIGLSYHQAKAIGGALTVVALLMVLPPPFSFGDDLFLNIPLAFAMYSYLEVPLFWALVFTYTVVPVLLFLVGIWIYPGGTINRLKMKLHRASNASQRMLHNPLVWLAAIFTIYVLVTYYNDGGHATIDWIINMMSESGML